MLEWPKRQRKMLICGERKENSTVEFKAQMKVIGQGGRCRTVFKFHKGGGGAGVKDHPTVIRGQPNPLGQNFSSVYALLSGSFRNRRAEKIL